jgi:hypothetical protein
MRRQNLKWVSFLLFSALFWSIFPLVANASAIIDISKILKVKLKYNEEEVELVKVDFRSLPSNKSQVIYTKEIWWGGSDSTEYYFVNSVPETDKSDKTSWYRVLFKFGDEENYWNLKQVNKLSSFNYSYGFVSAKDVEKLRIDGADKMDIEWIIQGRPLRFNVGDDITKLKKFNRLHWQEVGGKIDKEWRRTKTTTALTLRKNPSEDSEEFILPKGASIVDPLPWSAYAGGESTPEPLGHYADIEEHDWLAIVDGRSLEVIGWTKIDILYNRDNNSAYIAPTVEEIENSHLWNL